MNEVSIHELLNTYNPNIIDIRDNYSYNLDHIPGATNIPYYSLLSNYSMYLDKKNTYYLYCDYGHQSKEISDRLNMFGYHTYYIKEGYLYFKNNFK
jgi:rhodanese-related sulfurtransferase